MIHDQLEASGTYQISCTGPDGKEKWSFESPNLVCVGGANLALDAVFSGVGVGSNSYIGLITEDNFVNITRNDTMVSRQWDESTAAGPARRAIAWQSASTAKKRFSVPVKFPIIESDTIVGAFVVFGSASSATLNHTGGALWSATTFSNNSQTVQQGDTLSVQYTTSLLKLAAISTAVAVVETANGVDIIDEDVIQNVLAEHANAIDTIGVLATFKPGIPEYSEAIDTVTVISSLYHLSIIEAGAAQTFEDNTSALTYPIEETGEAIATASATGTSHLSLAEGETAEALSFVGIQPFVLEISPATNAQSAVSHYHLPISESGVSVATFTVAQHSPIVFAETASATDTPSAKTRFRPTVNESAPSVADLTGVRMVFRPVVNETTAASTTDHIGFHPVVFEIVIANATQSAVTDYHLPVSETSLATTSQSGLAIRPGSVTETGSATDGKTVKLRTRITESGSAVDSITAVTVFRPVVNETTAATTTDHVGFAPFVIETGIANATQSAVSHYHLLISETSLASTTQAALLSPAPLSITEAGSAADSKTVKLRTSLSESGSAATTQAATRLVTITENGSASATQTVKLRVAINESVTATDTTDGFFGNLVFLVDENGNPVVDENGNWIVISSG